MEVCRLCLDLVATQGEAKLFDGETRDMVQVVAPELNLEASKEPHACAECQRTLTRLFEFKSRVFEREAEVRAAVGTRRGKFGLKEALEGGDAKGTPSATTDPGGGDAPPKAKDRVCRTCLAPIECESFTVLRPSEPDAYLSSMLDVCLVEVDLELTLDPVMCEACLEQLQRLHHFRSACRDVEEKIVAFREGGGAGAGPVDLHAVLGAAAAAAPDVEMVTVKEEDEGAASSSRAVPRRGGRKRVKVEPAKVEPVKEEEEDEEDDESEEEEDDEDEDMSEGDEDDPDDELKQEELDIKSETGTSDSDRALNKQNNHNVKNETTRKYRCPQCIYQTCKKLLFELHLRQHSKQQFTLHCDKCPFETKSEHAFKAHQVKTHGDPTLPLFKCSECDYSTHVKSNFNRHAWRHFYRAKAVGLQDVHDEQQITDNDTDLFKCPHCPYTTFDNLYLPYHMKIHEEGRFDCKECPFKGKTGHELLKHRVELHGYQPPFKCSHCSYVSCRADHLKTHLTLHKESRFDCKECPFKGKTQQELVSHQVELHGYRAPFRCLRCPYVSHRKDAIKQHARIHEEKPFGCAECPFKGENRQELLKHQVKVHGYEAPFKCLHCSYVSHSKRFLKRHENVHKEGRLECEKCPFKGNTRQELTKHRDELHSDELVKTRMKSQKKSTNRGKSELVNTPETQICPYCSYSTINKAYFPHHMKVHKEGRFDCKKCPFKGKTRQKLVKHQAELHDKQAPFKCPHCPYVSYRNELLKVHMEVHREGRLDCKECPFKGKAPQELVKHRIDLHGYQLSFKCSHCLYASDDYANFRRHKKIHEKGSFVCKKCPFKGDTQQELEKHRVEVHGKKLVVKCVKYDFCSYTKDLMESDEKKVHSGESELADVPETPKSISEEEEEYLILNDCVG